ncbi:putative phage prohead protease (plasmid) [Selenomonas ruminantium subsp. lactilytica TAM6421]|uniref:Putative phage prohead protease n=1 Tax=Selenomonas ruminantium subsp. lactilytica (strain NBRC 103574 / TAM6421) TaxID=927704 RepID=I0GWQ9_SELRL|nr:HK97 family phage prohead protease [Selenomonas ruminantium]BAL85196.1 putative phage prohead protease [Selenomonas ruminantium subsp. lactilytica TAM6421]
MDKSEYRSTSASSIESADKKLTVHGYAAVFNSPSVAMPAAAYDYEILEQTAFDHCDMSRCVFRYNHDDSHELLARTSNNTLQLSVDEKGLKVVAEFADTQAGNDLYKLIQRRDVSAMSFGFIVRKDYIEHRVRHITDIARLIDVSAVDDPAYQSTSIDVVQRSIKAAEEAERRQWKDETLRQRMYIQSLY